MEEITYQGEHLLPGILGTSFVIISFLASLLAAVGFMLSTGKDEKGWLNFGRWNFRIHSIALFGIMASLLYILFNHLYEYEYAWKHLDNKMPIRYIFSCFWDGQEGSFILWAFWHVVLGLILIKFAGKWESRVLSVISWVQVFLGSMLIGVYFGDFQLGQNPFILMREVGSNFGMPWTMNPNYLADYKQFQDGTGLNPLLQNYWMTIHPPTLFLGFAAVVVPFAYAIAGLWKRDLTGWIKPAIPWTFFAVSALGTGILMGGAWAYEALGFGGFWAWDPVENASLVPWIMLVGAAHLLVINRRKANSLFATFLLTMGSFVFVLYSTYLTRSGVLGDTSVHSFVESGIVPQLLLYVLFFGGLSVYMLIGNPRYRKIYLGAALVSLIGGIALDGSAAIALFIIASLVFIVVTYRRDFPRPDKEEHLWSREFWVFIGVLVLIFSSAQIIIQTSLPVSNIFLEDFSGMFSSLYDSLGWEWLKSASEHDYHPPADVIPSYHKWQIPFTIVIMLLVAVTQFFKYKKTDTKDFLKKITGALVVSILVTILAIWVGGFSYHNWQVYALIFAAAFAFIANLDYILRVLKGKMDAAGASVAHIGFAMIIIGAVVSTSQQYTISENQLGDLRQMNEEFDNRTDMAMYEGDTLLMGPYFVLYKNKEKSEDGVHLNCDVEYFGKVDKFYREGDLVWIKGGMFRCMEDHQASDTFLDDFDLWSAVPMPNPRQTREAAPWVNGSPGKPLFDLEPGLIMNKSKGNSREPSIKHYWDHDVYTYLKYVTTEEAVADEEGWLEGRQHTVKVGDRVLVSNTMVSVDSLLGVKNPADYRLFETDHVAKLVLTLMEGNEEKVIEPLFILRESLIVPDVVDVPEWGLRFALGAIDPRTSECTLTIWEKQERKKDFIVMHAIIFPQINILWLGCIVMVIGTIMAIRHRRRLNKSAHA
ncbi:MAG: cytochrome c biogenesis protein CcsA [Flavobacteriales bacterium]|nr:cytochrome c biogenesis protein CcsA [Flavobacteriales bacterium]